MFTSAKLCVASFVRWKTRSSRRPRRHDPERREQRVCERLVGDQSVDDRCRQELRRHDGRPQPASLYRPPRRVAQCCKPRSPPTHRPARWRDGRRRSPCRDHHRDRQVDPPPQKHERGRRPSVPTALSCTAQAPPPIEGLACCGKIPAARLAGVVGAVEPAATVGAAPRLDRRGYTRVLGVEQVQKVDVGDPVMGQTEGLGWWNSRAQLPRTK